MYGVKTLNIIFPLLILFTLISGVEEYPKVYPTREHENQYTANKTKTIFELQQFRRTSSITIHSKTGEEGEATLINLNPSINAWYLLTIKWKKNQASVNYHLENPHPANNTFKLDPEYPSGIIVNSRGRQYYCDLWSSFQSGALGEVGTDNLPFTVLCSNNVYIRNKTKGNKTTLESATDFLRRRVPAGEKISTLVKNTFYKDKYFRTSEIDKHEEVQTTRSQVPQRGYPLYPLVDTNYSSAYLVPVECGLPVATGEKDNKLRCGEWHPVKNQTGVFFSLIQPKMVSEEVIKAQRGLAKPLDNIEQSALVFLVAFDLSIHEVGFELGTEHPGVEWSGRILPAMKDTKLPGPDGIGTMEPLINTGIVRPDIAHQVIATFTGGFKRYHGAFRNGPLATKNRAGHYGFIVHGVVMSKLQPGLATVMILKNGSVILKTWQDSDNRLLPYIRHARQNGVPIIEYDSLNNAVRPTLYVANSLYGNWSGSADGSYRTLRAGIALQEGKGRSFLIYGYFSTATPSAMARIFQAYRCSYALLTDMNALEHTYLALYSRADTTFQIHHLIKGMDVLDKNIKGVPVPRFLGFPDNRDFFYIMKKEKK